MCIPDLATGPAAFLRFDPASNRSGVLNRRWKLARVDAADTGAAAPAGAEPETGPDGTGVRETTAAAIRDGRPTVRALPGPPPCQLSTAGLRPRAAGQQAARGKPWPPEGSRRSPRGDTRFLINRSYARLWCGQAVSAVGDTVFATTLVVWVGEFGRSPKINNIAGRDHWPQCYPALLAGGGVRRGYVHGASDRLGAHPGRDPVRPEDLAATMFHLLGIDPKTEIHDALNRPLPISSGEVVSGVLA